MFYDFEYVDEMTYEFKRSVKMYEDAIVDLVLNKTNAGDEEVAAKFELSVEHYRYRGVCSYLLADKIELLKDVRELDYELSKKLLRNCNEILVEMLEQHFRFVDSEVMNDLVMYKVTILNFQAVMDRFEKKQYEFINNISDEQLQNLPYNKHYYGYYKNRLSVMMNSEMGFTCLAFGDTSILLASTIGGSKRQYQFPINEYQKALKEYEYLTDQENPGNSRPTPTRKQLENMFKKKSLI